MRFLGISQRTHEGNGLKFCIVLNPVHLWSWLDYGYGLVIFIILVLFWFSEMGQIWGFRAFTGETIEEMAWNGCMLVYPDYINNWLDYDHSMLIFLILVLFRLGETGQIWCFRAFWSCSVDLGLLGIIWRMCGSKCRGGSEGIFPTLCVEFCQVWYRLFYKWMVYVFYMRHHGLDYCKIELGLVSNMLWQKRCNPIAGTLEICVFGIEPSICYINAAEQWCMKIIFYHINGSFMFST